MSIIYSNEYNTNNNINNHPTNYNKKLMEEYNTNLNKIKDLNTKLNDYDSKINEITKLNIKLNHLNDLIKSKNKIIYEHEHLSRVTREKLIACINKNKNDNNYEKLQKNIYRIKRAKRLL